MANFVFNNDEQVIGGETSPATNARELIGILDQYERQDARDLRRLRV